MIRIKFKTSPPLLETKAISNRPSIQVEKTLSPRTLVANSERAWSATPWTRLMLCRRPAGSSSLEIANMNTTSMKASSIWRDLSFLVATVTRTMAATHASHLGRRSRTSKIATVTSVDVRLVRNAWPKHVYSRLQEAANATYLRVEEKWSSVVPFASYVTGSSWSETWYRAHWKRSKLPISSSQLH